MRCWTYLIKYSPINNFSFRFHRFYFSKRDTYFFRYRESLCASFVLGPYNFRPASDWDNLFNTNTCRTFCRENSCAKTSSVRCGYGLVRSVVFSSVDFQNIVQYFSATGKYFASSTVCDKTSYLL